MKRSITLAVSVLIAVSIYAWQWPVADGVLSTTFGQWRRGGFSQGVILSGGAERVYPASDGELVFHFESRRTAHPLGNFVVLHHEGGFRTVYANLEPGSTAADQLFAAVSEPLARVGGSGYATGQQTIFQIIDEELDAFVNPLLILPERPDTRAPVLAGIMIARNGEVQPAGSLTTIAAPGDVTLLAEVYDPGVETAFLRILAPYEIVLVQDDREVRRITFETLQGRDGSLLLGGIYTAEQLYRSQRVVDLGQVEVTDEPSSITISVRDFSGNIVQRTIILQSEY